MSQNSSPDHLVEPVALPQPDLIANIGDLWDKATGHAPVSTVATQLPAQDAIKTWNYLGKHVSSAEITDLARQQVARSSGHTLLKRGINNLGSDRSDPFSPQANKER